MTSQLFRVSLIAAALAAACMLAGCPPQRPAPVQTDLQSQISAKLHPAIRGTIGEFATLIDSSPMSVEGYGLVVGLADTGARGDIDPTVRDILLHHLLITGVGEIRTGTREVSPEAILDSAQTAAVEVRGLIPPLARKGTTFDVYVNALPGSGTTSLNNGLLWPSDLKQINIPGHDSHMIAMGRGPVFIPAVVDAAADRAAGKEPQELPKAVLSGRLIAGGVVSEDRAARLQVYVNNAMRTRFIERAINARFPGRDKAATAENDAIVSLHIPADYADNPMDFVELVRHLYLNTGEPGFVQDRARALIAAFDDPTAPKRDLGLALQGLGTSIIPEFLEPNYTSPNQELRFWCARAGACMQNVQGMATLQEMARNPGNPFHRQAVIAMVEASRHRDTTLATLTLMDMITSMNTDDRILAYHALLAIRSRAVQTYDAGRKFMIDIIVADCPPLIYVLESDSPRIAFIGQPLTLAPGDIYLSRDKHLTVDFPEGVDAASAATPVITAAVSSGAYGTAGTKPALKEPVKIYWRPLNGSREVTMFSVAGLPSIVYRAAWIPQPDPNDPYERKQVFIGASYQRMAEMLAEMCADKVIKATYVVQRSADQVLNPADIALSGRPDTSPKPPAPPPPPAPGKGPEMDVPPLQP
jgi:flagellar basal body P-ring protein FlgI